MPAETSKEQDKLDEIKAKLDELERLVRRLTEMIELLGLRV